MTAEAIAAEARELLGEDVDVLTVEKGIDEYTRRANRSPVSSSVLNFDTGIPFDPGEACCTCE